MVDSLEFPALPSACQRVVPLLPAYIDDSLASSQAATVAAHLPTCRACGLRVEQLRALPGQLAALPTLAPPPALRTDFLAALSREQALLMPLAEHPTVVRSAATSQRPASRVIPLWEASGAGRWLRIAASVALLAMGTALGLLLRPGTRPEIARQPEPAASLSAQLATATAQLATTSHRIQLVSELDASGAEGDAAVQALIITLNTDPNSNVRLAAAEALYRLRADARVGLALAQALPRQTDPNVQLTLIELLVALHEKQALAPLERLARQADALPVVRQQAERGAAMLI